jgi:hypothetical protein
MLDVEIELVGGPRDGERITVPLTDPVPAPHLEMTTVDSTVDGLPDIWRLNYRRDDAPTDDAVWRYRFLSTQHG